MQKNVSINRYENINTSTKRFYLFLFSTRLCELVVGTGYAKIALGGNEWVMDWSVLLTRGQSSWDRLRIRRHPDQDKVLTEDE